MHALLTDLYELNMVASYLRRGMNGQATFSLFVRRLPETRGFLVAAGVEGCLDYLEQLRFEAEDLRYLGEVLKFRPSDLEAFKRFRFTGDIWAVPEGGIVFAGEILPSAPAAGSRTARDATRAPARCPVGGRFPDRPRSNP